MIDCEDQPVPVIDRRSDDRRFSAQRLQDVRGDLRVLERQRGTGVQCDDIGKDAAVTRQQGLEGHTIEADQTYAGQQKRGDAADHRDQDDLAPQRQSRRAHPPSERHGSVPDPRFRPAAWLGHRWTVQPASPHAGRSQRGRSTRREDRFQAAWAGVASARTVGGLVEPERSMTSGQVFPLHRALPLATPPESRSSATCTNVSTASRPRSVRRIGLRAGDSLV